jgi:superfamily I DNA/RNA helicase
MKDMYALIEFVNKTNDTQLKMLTSIVNKHNTNIPFIINMIKNKHVDNHERYKADIIFSTTHRCKGLEYDTVYLANDFIKLNELVINETPNAQIIEEINLLYVAITRAKNKVFLPESISEYCTS